MQLFGEQLAALRARQSSNRRLTSRPSFSAHFCWDLGTASTAFASDTCRRDAALSAWCAALKPQGRYPARRWPRFATRSPQTASTSSRTITASLIDRDLAVRHVKRVSRVPARDRPRESRNGKDATFTRRGRIESVRRGRSSQQVRIARAEGVERVCTAFAPALIGMHAVFHELVALRSVSIVPSAPLQHPRMLGASCERRPRSCSVLPGFSAGFRRGRRHLPNFGGRFAVHPRGMRSKSRRTAAAIGRRSRVPPHQLPVRPAVWRSNAWRRTPFGFCGPDVMLADRRRAARLDGDRLPERTRAFVAATQAAFADAPARRAVPST